MADHASTQYCRQTRYAKLPSILRAFKPWCLNVCTLGHYTIVELDATRAPLKFMNIESLSASGVRIHGRSTLEWPHCSPLIWPH
jgi:hypothetical protein